MLMDCHQVLQACPQNPPPENLFVNLAHESSLLSCLGGYVNSAMWYDEIKSRLLGAEDDVTGRTDDPQGSLTRFGDGVVFAEAIVAHFKVNSPDRCEWYELC